MKKKLIVIIVAVIALIMVVVAYVMIPDGVKDISGIEKERQTVYIGQTISPDYIIKPSKFKDKKSEIAFEMSDSEVASVDVKGAITAKKIGETVLTLSVMNYSEEVTIEVIPTIKKISNVVDEISITEGDIESIAPKLVPAEKKFANEKIKYTMEDKSIASINKNGKITAKKPGKTMLLIEAGGCKLEISIIINEYIPPEPEPVAVPYTYTYPDTDYGTGSTTKDSTQVQTEVMQEER